MSIDVLRYLREPGAEASGRDAEISSILRAHDEARQSGRAHFVSLRGAVGVGKSHVVQQVAQALSQRGVTTFEGGSAREVRRPWGTFAPMIGELLTHLARSGVPENVVAQVARQAELIRSGHAEAGSLDRQELLDAMAKLFALAGRSCPVFVLPDLDVTDRSSLELLRVLATAAVTPESRMGGLFLLTFRDDGSLPTVLVDTLQLTQCKSVSLNGLDLEGIRSFLSRNDVAQKLLDLTGGNPDLLSALIERPAASADFFLRFASKLTGAQQQVLSVLALTPESLSGELIAKTAGTTIDEAARALDALARERVISVKTADAQSTWRFSREGEKAAYSLTLANDVRSAIQLKLGRALVAQGSLMVGAELLLQVAPAEGAQVAVKAAQTLVDRGALEEAAAIFQAVMPQIGTAERGSVAAAQARVLAPMGAYGRAARRFMQAARLSEATERLTLLLEGARSLQKRGRLSFADAVLRELKKSGQLTAETDALTAEGHLLKGETAEAIATSRRALAVAEGKATLALRNVLGKALLVQGHAAEAELLFADNVSEATEYGEPQLAALARLNQGVAAFKRGDTESAIAAWENTPEAHRPAHAQAQANLGSAFAEAGNFEQAIEHLSRALRSFSLFASAREVSLAASNLARVYLFLGELERAAELSQYALDRARQLGDVYLEAGALLNLGTLRYDEKRAVDALPLLEEARVKFERVGNRGYAALAAAMKARVHLSSHERAQAELELARTCVTEGAPLLHAAELEVALTRAELALGAGDLHAAGRAAVRAREALLSHHDFEGPIRTAVVMGRLRLAAADHSGAQGEFQRAARLLDDVVQKIAPARRSAFLAVPRRGDVLAAVEPELRATRAPVAATPSAVERSIGFIGKSAALQLVVKQLEPIGRSNATVLVRGESGTGKEVLADALHTMSPRRHMPLVKVNCAAMVEELLLSELFGHEKGAFTGAIKERKGRFEMADGGTIFLDEIGDISPKAQVALLRVLQEREFERVGGSKTLKVDVRVICATNRNLEQLIEQGRFRADLYYRLKGVMLELPPLRDRLEDLSTLAQHFLDKATKERQQAPQRLSDDSLALLARHNWPGNVRELENVVSSASIFAEGAVVTPEAFMHVSELRALAGGLPVQPIKVPAMVAEVTTAPVAAAPTPTAVSAESAGPIDFYELARARGISLKDLRHEIEMQCIRRALIESQGNISEAARLLLMKRSRLSQIVNAEPMLREVAHGDE